MEGFEIFIYIILGVTLLFVIASILLKRTLPEKNDKYIRKGFAGSLLVSVGIIIFGFFVGGWNGMGYGLIGVSILIGTVLGGFIHGVIK